MQYARGDVELQLENSLYRCEIGVVHVILEASPYSYVDPPVELVNQQMQCMRFYISVHLSDDNLVNWHMDELDEESNEAHDEKADARCESDL